MRRIPTIKLSVGLDANGALTTDPKRLDRECPPVLMRMVRDADFRKMMTVCRTVEMAVRDYDGAWAASLQADFISLNKEPKKP